MEDIVVQTVGDEPFEKEEIVVDKPSSPINVPLSYIEKEEKKPKVLVLGD